MATAAFANRGVASNTNATKLSFDKSQSVSTSASHGVKKEDGKRSEKVHSVYEDSLLTNLSLHPSRLASDTNSNTVPKDFVSPTHSNVSRSVQMQIHATSFTGGKSNRAATSKHVVGDEENHTPDMEQVTAQSVQPVSISSLSIQQLQGMITNSIKTQFGCATQRTRMHSKPYTKRIDNIKMPPKFLQFDGIGNPKQHIAHFIKTGNSAGKHATERSPCQTICLIP
ncbi:hypothetical protein Acr_28g0007900 [Actinidia rufa]|uniref:Ty3-gypsy retrotransposon protein n=1 Tax=Actinidia rufa TaxID=165716 RepID=A0A7J0HAT2_9ERIC|nr:hypothetical protein Acr_28g0007900 [Actinidia rufa]